MWHGRLLTFEGERLLLALDEFAGVLQGGEPLAVEAFVGRTVGVGLGAQSLLLLAQDFGVGGLEVDLGGERTWLYSNARSFS